jgi:hypothetical protein
VRPRDFKEDSVRHLLVGLFLLSFVLGVKAQSNIIDAYTQSGADVCAKIQNGYNALPSTGGTVDARGFQGTQSACASGLSLTTKPAYILLDKATIPLGTNQIIIQNDAVRIKGAPSFHNAEGTQFTYSGNSGAIYIGDGTHEIYNVEVSGVQVVAQGSAASSTNAVGIWCRNCRYAKMDEPSVQGFAANVGIAFQSTSSSFDATNDVYQPFLWNNLAGIYTSGTSGGHTANQLRITGGFVICNNISGSSGIYFDVYSNLMQVWGTDIESCKYGIRNVGSFTFISGSHTENILTGGSHILNDVGATNLGEFGHTFSGGATYFTDSGTGTRRCDYSTC